MNHNTYYPLQFHPLHSSPFQPHLLKQTVSLPPQNPVVRPHNVALLHLLILRNGVQYPIPSRCGRIVYPARRAREGRNFGRDALPILPVELLPVRDGLRAGGGEGGAMRRPKGS